MFNQFIFADISSKDFDRRRFLTHKSNLIAIEIVPQSDAPLYKKIIPFSGSRFLWVRTFKTSSFKVRSDLVVRQLGNSEKTTCRIDEVYLCHSGCPFTSNYKCRWTILQCESIPFDDYWLIYLVIFMRHSECKENQEFLLYSRFCSTSQWNREDE